MYYMRRKNNCPYNYSLMIDAEVFFVVFEEKQVNVSKFHII